MYRRIFTASLFVLTLLGLCGSAGASGLGKFVGGTSERRVKSCEQPPAPSGFGYRTRFSALAGVTRAYSEESAFSLYGDLGYRIVNTTGGCRRSTGMFSSTNWWWHSVILGVDAELIPSQVESSPVGLMLTYDVRRQSKGFLSELSDILPFGAGISVGPHRAAGEWGVGAALFLRAMFDFRVGVDYDAQHGASTSIHVGIIDPHLIVLNLVDN